MLAARGGTRQALSALLELLLAAGLLRLAAEPGWRTLVTAASIIALRRLLAYGVARAEAAATV